MERRGIQFVRQVPSTYAKKLLKLCRKDEPQRMLDFMIMASLIEARSCERMRILSEHLIEQDPKLAQFYRGLLACEARHHQIYLDLIQDIFPKDVVQSRLEEMAAAEQAIVDIPSELPRMHSWVLRIRLTLNQTKPPFGGLVIMDEVTLLQLV